MLDYAEKGKSVSSLSTVSSTLPLMATEDRAEESAFESEITETEDDEAHERSEVAETCRRVRPRHSPPCSQEDTVISTPGGCGCHFYRAHDAMLYTAHVGDCRAVLLGSAPPRTIKVPDDGAARVEHTVTTEDDSSYHSSDETEYMGTSSDRGADSSDDDVDIHEKPASLKAPSHIVYMRRPSRRQGLRNSPERLQSAPKVTKEESDNEFEVSPSCQISRNSYGSVASRRSSESVNAFQYRQTLLPPLYLSPLVRPIDLTTDHSAYNPAEVAAVLRRCKNAPRAISANLGSTVKRVAGSLAVTRALGDAYLKTPLLSFTPFKR